MAWFVLEGVKKLVLSAEDTPYSSFQSQSLTLPLFSVGGVGLWLDSDAGWWDSDAAVVSPAVPSSS